MMSRFSKGAIVGAATAMLGLLLSFLPFSLDLEETFGLHLLFDLRGARPAPPDVVVVSIDKPSADMLGLPGDPAKWPRALHARLTANLARAGAAVIAFDIFFEEARVAEEDRLFADAVRAADNVVLSKYLLRESAPLAVASGGRVGDVNIERLLSPLGILQQAALASAPFPLPKVPVRVNQYWTFKSGAGGAPTLPVVAFQVFALDVWPDFRRLLVQVHPAGASALPPDRRALVRSAKVEETINAVRDLFQAQPGTEAAMLRALDGDTFSAGEAGRRDLLRALIRMYGSPDSQYLNFYGYPGWITTLPYSRAVAEEQVGSLERVVRGKAVFVGMSEFLRPEQKDGFYTVFSKEGGLDLSGVEIAATAFGNLKEDFHVWPMSMGGHVAVVLMCAAAFALLCTVLAPAWAAGAVLALGLVYLAVAQYRFVTSGFWYPVAVPLLLQAPFAFVLAVLWRYADTNRERQTMRKAFSYYLPDKAIDQLLSKTGVGSPSQLVYGICLFTDAEQYTGLAERLEPGDLAIFMNEYYATVFEPVKRHGGIVSDVVGDAALAIWATANPEVALRNQACLAACDISDALNRFNEQSGGAQLPTRVGLHAGPIMLGNVGAIDHYEYRAVGDIVNTATRIQGLNKHFGTRMLASEEVVIGLDRFLTRKLGTFLLAGKSKPLVVYELLCARPEGSPRQLALCRLFAEGLSAYEKQSWHQARDMFAAVISEYGTDGPSQLYLRLSAQYVTQPPDAPWDGVVRVDK